MTLAFLFTVIGGVLAIVGYVLVLIEAWQYGILWGLGTLIFPLVELFFVAFHWRKTRRGFLIQILGFFFMIIGLGLRMGQR
jgi:hypothetical protein